MSKHPRAPELAKLIAAVKAAGKPVLVVHVTSLGPVTAHSDWLNEQDELREDADRALRAALARLRTRFRAANLELPIQVVHNAGFRLSRPIDLA